MTVPSVPAAPPCSARTVLPAVMEAFYARLFEVDPSTKPLFAKSDMVKQGKATGDMISAAVDGLGDLAALVPVLQVCCVFALEFSATRCHS